ncbi:hypothetical protein V6N12_044657 [Hibiscus sabdariffa]|uniref:Uncharacterized protein n=1 Tax=Hibiscus sabdariffa TaxID=183260 RepID=A0ABR2AXI3_9ROSI
MFASLISSNGFRSSYKLASNQNSKIASVSDSSSTLINPVSGSWRRVLMGESSFSMRSMKGGKEIPKFPSQKLCSSPQIQNNSIQFRIRL